MIRNTCPRRSRRPRKFLLWAGASLLLSLGACTKPTFDAARLGDSVRDICRKEYGFDASARLAGKTLYSDVAPQHLVGPDMGLDRKTVERLYDALLTVTRVALSSDAKADFLVVRAKDANTGSVITLLRYVPDIKWYFYMRISRADFESRGVMEIDRPAEGSAEDFHEIGMPEFMARLTASKLQQKITYNPLVSVFLRVHRVTGIFQDGLLSIRLDKTQGLGLKEGEAGETATPDAFLKNSFIKAAADVVNRYDEDKAVRRVQAVEEGGRVVFDFTRDQLLKERRKLPKAKKWGPDEDY